MFETLTNPYHIPHPYPLPEYNSEGCKCLVLPDPQKTRHGPKTAASDHERQVDVVDPGSVIQRSVVTSCRDMEEGVSWPQKAADDHLENTSGHVFAVAVGSA